MYFDQIVAHFLAIFAALILGGIFTLFGFIAKQPGYINLADTLDSSPLFNFPFGKHYIIFHECEGIKLNATKNVELPMYKQKISKIFGKRFHYDKITYKELLDNDQL